MNIYIYEMQESAKNELIQLIKQTQQGHSLLKDRHTGRKWQVDADGVWPGMSTNTVMLGCLIHLFRRFSASLGKNPVTQHSVLTTFDTQSKVRRRRLVYSPGLGYDDQSLGCQFQTALTT